MQWFDLSGKTAIVTGGNGGIGLGIARGLADAGARVVIAGRNEAKNEAAVESIQASGHACVGVKCDVAIPEDIAATVETTLSEFGGVDILVNNAGISGGGAPERLEEAVWDEVLDVNLKSVLRFCQACHPHMKSAGGGKIINIGSMYSLFGSAVVSPYAASKGGVIQLTRSLAVAWARHNIQVNAILPGWIATDMTAGAMDNKAFYDLIVTRTPAGRFGVPDELAGAGVFLASKASDFATGISLPVDGGYSIS
ncbi:MAG: glucose 1-dehydrogenase [Pseudomonadales bacterium]|nr:glucose 1-dehydrogenase [Pseudomonadales bacterium]